MKALVLHFFDRVVQHGPSVVPYIEEKDGQKSDDELFHRVLQRDVDRRSGSHPEGSQGIEVIEGTDMDMSSDDGISDDSDPDWSPKDK